jgi:hypothetical protein
MDPSILILKMIVNLFKNCVLSIIGKIPLLFIDVNLGKDRGMQRLILFEEDDPVVIAGKFSIKYNLNEQKRLKLEKLLQIKITEYKKK